jgi:hypothetical protein
MLMRALCGAMKELLPHLSSWRVFGVVSILVYAANCVAGVELYRYINDKGVPVTSHNIPPEFIPNGFEVINPDGTLIRRVSRQLSEQELLLRDSGEAKLRFRQEEEKRLEEWDKSLMLRYSSIDDIVAVCERAVYDQKVRISILKSNLISIKSQIEREQQKAANIERGGREVPVDLTKTIDILRLEIQDTERAIELRNEEITALRASYQHDIDRFKTLIDRVNMRRQQNSSNTDYNKRVGYY